jgi:electron transport complex protein RnfB
VLTQYCTGCELCLAPCPVDCIDMVELGTLAQQCNRHAMALVAQSSELSASVARRRFGLHQLRVERENAERSERLTNKAGKFAPESTPGHDRARKTALVQAAIERSRARRAQFSKQ